MLVRLPPAFLVLLALLFGIGVFLLLHALITSDVSGTPEVVDGTYVLKGALSGPAGVVPRETSDLALLHDLRLRIGMYGSGFASTAALAAVLAKHVGGVDRPRRA